MLSGPGGPPLAPVSAPRHQSRRQLSPCAALPVGGERSARHHGRRRVRADERRPDPPRRASRQDRGRLRRDRHRALRSRAGGRRTRSGRAAPPPARPVRSPRSVRASPIGTTTSCGPSRWSTRDARMLGSGWSAPGPRSGRLWKRRRPRRSRGHPGGYRDDIPEILAASQVAADGFPVGLGITGTLPESIPGHGDAGRRDEPRMGTTSWCDMGASSSPLGHRRPSAPPASGCGTSRRGPPSSVAPAAGSWWRASRRAPRWSGGRSSTGRLARSGADRRRHAVD